MCFSSAKKEKYRSPRACYTRQARPLLLRCALKYFFMRVSSSLTISSLGVETRYKLCVRSNFSDPRYRQVCTDDPANPIV